MPSFILHHRLFFSFHPSLYTFCVLVLATRIFYETVHMRCWITGASGWIGYHLVRALAADTPTREFRLILPPTPLHPAEGRRAHALQADGFTITTWDLLQPPPLDLGDEPIDLLLHLAAFTHTETRSDAVRVNDLGTENLLRVLGPRLARGRVLFPGSIASIDAFDPPDTGVDESTPCRPLTAYGRSKLAAERIIQAAAGHYGFAWTILRLPTVHGAGGYRPGGLFDRLKQCAHTHHPLVRVAWPGSLTLLDVNDLVALIPRVLANDACANQLLHVGDPNPVRFTDLAAWAESSTVARFRRNRAKPVLVEHGLQRCAARLLLAVVLPLVRSGRLPHTPHIALWRLSHLLGNSMVSDTRAFQRLVPAEYSDPRLVLRELFREEST